MTKQPTTSAHHITSYYHTRQSLTSRLIYYFLKLSGLKFFLSRQTRSDVIRKTGKPLPPKRLPKNISITTQRIQNSNVFTIIHNAGQTEKHIIYLHGGAFVISFASLHWKFMIKLVRETRCTIIAPDYPLSPVYSYKERFALLDPLYKFG